MLHKTFVKKSRQCGCGIKVSLAQEVDKKLKGNAILTSRDGGGPCRWPELNQKTGDP